MVRASLACLMLFVAADGFPGRVSGQAPEGFPAPGAPPVVSLLAAGPPPRTPLRYVVAANQTERMSLTMSMNMAMAMTGAAAREVALPPVTLLADIAVTEVAASGDFSYSMSFADVVIGDGQGVEPGAMVALQSLNQLKNLRGAGTVTNRGITRGVTLDASGVVDPRLSQMMSSMANTFQNLSMPFPEEEVGIGARWESRQVLSSNGLQTYQKTTMELVALDESAATFTVTTEQTAPAQVIESPSLPPGAEVRIEEFAGTGSGTVKQLLTSLVPVSEATARTSMQMRVTAGANSQTVTIQTTMKVGVSPVR